MDESASVLRVYSHRMRNEAYNIMAFKSNQMSRLHDMSCISRNSKVKTIS
jgi:hypothetical protein